MKAVKEELQFSSRLKQPSEMEDVPQKITLKDKLTLSSQILAQTLQSYYFIQIYLAHEGVYPVHVHVHCNCIHLVHCVWHKRKP